jgi:YVTN family beta-propeller protein
MKSRNAMHVLPGLVLIMSLLLACNATAILAGDQDATALPEPTLPDLPAPTEEPAQRVQLEPCALLMADEVSAILGGPVDMQPAPGTGGCLYMLQSDDPAMMTQLVLSAAQGNEAKALTLLSLGMLAGFSGDPGMMGEFEALNEQLPELTLAEVVSRMGALFQGTPVQVTEAAGPGESALWLLYEDDFFSQGTLLLVRGEEYVSLTMIGGEMESAPDRLSPLGAAAFERLPPDFYVLDEDGDGTFSFEYSSEGDEGERQPSPVVGGLVWVTAPNAGQVHAIDPMTDQVIATIEVGRFPRDIAVAGGNVWVLSETAGTLWRIDPGKYEVVETIQYNGNTTHVDAGPDAVWVSGGLGVRKIDLATNTRHDVVYNACYDVAIGEDAVWVSQTQDQQLLRIDPETRKVVATVKLDGQPTAIIYGHGLVWAVLQDRKELVGIDPASGQVVFTQPYEYVVHDMAMDESRLWYTSPFAIQYIEPETGAGGGIGAETSPVGIEVYAGSLWATGGEEGLLTRYDPDDGNVIAEIELDADAGGIAAGE